jgi:hypothetical protein
LHWHSQNCYTPSQREHVKFQFKKENLNPDDLMAVWLQFEISVTVGTKKIINFLKNQILLKSYLFPSDNYFKMLSKLLIGA